MEVGVPNVPGRVNDGPEYFVLKVCVETWNFSSNMEEPWDYHYQSEAQHGVHSLISINVHSSTKFTTKKIEVETVVSALLCGLRIRSSGRKEFVSLRHARYPTSQQ
jgi:hypothetical protein